MLEIPTERNKNTSYEKLEAYLEELQDSLDELEEIEEEDRTEEQKEEIVDLENDIEDLNRVLRVVDSRSYLIHEDNIRQYIQEDVEDNWPIPDFIASYINWEELIDNALPDYESIDIDGEYYYWR